MAAQKPYSHDEEIDIWCFLSSYIDEEKEKGVENEVLAKIHTGIEVWEAYKAEKHSNRTAEEIRDFFNKDLINRLDQAQLSSRITFSLYMLLGIPIKWNAAAKLSRHHNVRLKIKDNMLLGYEDIGDAPDRSDENIEEEKDDEDSQVDKDSDVEKFDDMTEEQEEQLWRFVAEKVLKQNAKLDDIGMWTEYLESDKESTAKSLKQFFISNMLPFTYKARGIDRENILGLYKKLAIPVETTVEPILESKFQCDIRLNPQRAIVDFSFWGNVAVEKPTVVSSRQLREPKVEVDETMNSPKNQDEAPSGYTKRLRIKREMETDMWKYILKRLRKHASDLRKVSTHKFWTQYAETTCFPRSGQAFQNHYLNKMSELAYQADLDGDTIIELYCRLEEPISESLAKMFSTRYQVQLKLDDERRLVEWNANDQSTLHQDDEPEHHQEEVREPAGGVAEGPKENQQNEVQVKIEPTPKTKKRVKFTVEEDVKMWRYILKQVKLNKSGSPKGLMFWEAFVKKTKSSRSADNLSSHYRKQMVDNLYRMPMNRKEILELYTSLKLPVTAELKEALEENLNATVCVKNLEIVSWKCVGQDEEEMEMEIDTDESQGENIFANDHLNRSSYYDFRPEAIEERVERVAFHGQHRIRERAEAWKSRDEERRELERKEQERLKQANAARVVTQSALFQQPKTPPRIVRPGRWDVPAATSSPITKSPNIEADPVKDASPMRTPSRTSSKRQIVSPRTEPPPKRQNTIQLGVFPAKNTEKTCLTTMVDDDEMGSPPEEEDLRPVPPAEMFSPKADHPMPSPPKKKKKSPEKQIFRGASSSTSTISQNKVAEKKRGERMEIDVEATQPLQVTECNGSNESALPNITPFLTAVIAMFAKYGMDISKRATLLRNFYAQEQQHVAANHEGAQWHLMFGIQTKLEECAEMKKFQKEHLDKIEKVFKVAESSSSQLRLCPEGQKQPLIVFTQGKSSIDAKYREEIVLGMAPKSTRLSADARMRIARFLTDCDSICAPIAKTKEQYCKLIRSNIPAIQSMMAELQC